MVVGVPRKVDDCIQVFHGPFRRTAPCAVCDCLIADFAGSKKVRLEPKYHSTLMN